MYRSCILAHRGLHFCKEEKNSSGALKRAIDEGFGIETDLRDLDRKVVISHDPPCASSNLLSLDWLLDQILSYGYSGRVALNIKSDGLAKIVSQQIQAKLDDGERCFVFDMSVPDSLSYVKENIGFYTRLSNFEGTPACLEIAKGVWIDDFSGDFPQIEHALDLIGHGYRVAIVSPELHGRDHAKVWDRIEESQVFRSPLFELCTDLPLDAAARFCGSSSS